MKKIMFNDRYGLTEAVLSGRKTQTRRLIPIDLYNVCDWREEIPMFEDGYGDWHPFYESKYVYKVGEVVAVAQSYKDAGYSKYAINRAPKTMEIRGHMEESAGWNNKMFVRAEACKNRIRITNVRVERLRDISDEDCIKEGIDSWTCRGKRHFGFFDNAKDKFSRHTTPREAYAALIDRISGKGTWESNPYVFVYDFELAK